MIVAINWITVAWVILLSINQINCIYQKYNKKPHVILILADDMGFNDVSFHGSNQILTPNIDALAYYGIALNKFYTAPMCSPSRSALMTGKYASNVGMQHYVIASDQPWGLPLKEKLLPEYMRDGGYSTHLIGKWHMGFYRKEYTPLYRGFDSHFGYLGPYIDYWDHSLLRTGASTVFARGLDMRENLTMNYNTKGIYATDLFTDYAVKTFNEHNKDIPLFMVLSHLAPHSGNTDDPMQAPQLNIDEYNFISHVNRSVYAAMVSKLDQSIGQLIDGLKNNNMLDDTIIIFLSDNGSPSIGENANYGSNAPLRGQKDSPWEGAVRNVGIIWSTKLISRQRVSNQMFHITDLFKTLVDIADVPLIGPINGVNIWNALSLNLKSPRNEILCNYDRAIGYSSLIYKKWKLINGTTLAGAYDHYLGVLNQSEIHPLSSTYAENVFYSKTSIALQPFSKGITKYTYDTYFHHLRTRSTVTCLSPTPLTACNPLVAPCLFDLETDPCEQNNLAFNLPKVLARLQNRLYRHLIESELPRNKPSDPKSNPKYFNGTWTWWFDELNLPDHIDATNSFFDNNFQQYINAPLPPPSPSSYIF